MRLQTRIGVSVVARRENRQTFGINRLRDGFKKRFESTMQLQNRTFDRIGDHVPIFAALFEQLFDFVVGQNFVEVNRTAPGIVDDFNFTAFQIRREDVFDVGFALSFVDGVVGVERRVKNFGVKGRAVHDISVA